jgi:hypothetical protein
LTLTARHVSVNGMTRLPRIIAPWFAVVSIACGSPIDWDSPAPSNEPPKKTTDFPAVVAVNTSLGLTITFCTGVIVGRRAVLSWDYCSVVPAGDLVRAQVVTPAGILTAQDARVSKTLQLGLMAFDRDVAEADQIISIGTAVSVGDTVTLVAMDNASQIKADWTKRYGTNRVGYIDDGYIYVATPDVPIGCPFNRAGICTGDAALGGPMLSGTAVPFSVTGVLIGRAEVSGQGQSEISSYRDLTQADARAFLKSAAAEMKIEIAGL